MNGDRYLLDTNAVVQLFGVYDVPSDDDILTQMIGRHRVKRESGVTYGLG